MGLTYGDASCGIGWGDEQGGEEWGRIFKHEKVDDKQHKDTVDTRSDRSMISLSLVGQRWMNSHKEIDSRVSGLVITDQDRTFQRTRF